MGNVRRVCALSACESLPRELMTQHAPSSDPPQQNRSAREMVAQPGVACPPAPTGDPIDVREPRAADTQRQCCLTDEWESQWERGQQQEQGRAGQGRAPVAAVQGWRILLGILSMTRCSLSTGAPRPWTALPGGVLQGGRVQWWGWGQCGWWSQDPMLAP